MTDKFAKIAALSTVAGWGFSKAGTVYEWFKRKTTARVVCYGEFLEALFVELGPEAFGPYVEYGALCSSMPEPVSSSDAPKTRLTSTPGPGMCVRTLEGKRVAFNYVLEKGEYGRETRYVVVTSHIKHFAWLKSWIESCVESYQGKRRTLLDMKTPNSGGYFDHAGSRPRRPLDTVDHPDFAPQVMVKMIEEWQETEQAVIARGENFHIGFLLHGPPGTGKTSTGIAIASHLGRDLYVVTPSDLKAGFPPSQWRHVSGGVLMIEECDEVFPARGNGHDDKATSSLLSAFDGPFSPWNVVRIYTTNHIDRLDPSFRRKGRVDHEFEFPKREIESVRGNKRDV